MVAQSRSKAQAETLGIPAGFKLWSTGELKGMNQQDSRTFIEDSEQYWRENFIRIGKGNLRTLWDAGVPLYTVPTTQVDPNTGQTAKIVLFFWFNIGTTEYCAIFTSDGLATQVDTMGNVTPISTVSGTFYQRNSDGSAGQLPACCQYGSQYLLISNNFTGNCYFIWDGENLYQAGTISPLVNILSGGSNYTSPPKVSVTNLGAGVTAPVLTAQILNGSVSQVIVESPGSGFTIKDFPTVVFTGGGNNTISASAFPVIENGGVFSVDISYGGENFTSIPQIVFTGANTFQAVARVTSITNGSITGIEVTNSGGGYSAPPTISTTGGGGSGLVATAVMANGVIAGIQVSAADPGKGYSSPPGVFIVGDGAGATAESFLNPSDGSISSIKVTSSGSGYTNAAIIFTGGGGDVAIATVKLMPFGISGTSIETYQERIWITSPFQTGKQTTYGGIFLATTAQSVTDFVGSDGGVLFVSSERFLRAKYTALRQVNGYLYPFGDSCVDIISNVNTTGQPPTTTFSYQNTDPQIGTSWRDSIQDFSRTSLFANPLGIFGLYGGAVTKVSSKMDMVFDNAILPPNSGALLPSSAVADIYNRKTYLLLITIKDPFTSSPRNVMVSWDEEDWFISSQTPGLIYIGTQEINTILTAWGTDGNSLYPLFNSPSASLQKIFATKEYGVEEAFIIKQLMSLYVQGQDNSVDLSGLTLDATIDVSGLAFQDPNYRTVPSGAYGGNMPISFQAPYPNWPVYGLRLAQAASINGQPNPNAGESTDIYGMMIGATFRSTSPDFTLSGVAFGVMDVACIYA